MRGLRCVSQSSKEQLRRSRTESSGAAPAIEELPGGARQCKARRAAMRRSWQHGSVFSRARRSGGSQALQLPHLPFRRGSLLVALAPDRVLQKSEIPAPVLTSPIVSAQRAPSGFEIASVLCFSQPRTKGGWHGTRRTGLLGRTTVRVLGERFDDSGVQRVERTSLRK